MLILTTRILSLTSGKSQSYHMSSCRTSISNSAVCVNYSKSVFLFL